MVSFLDTFITPYSMMNVSHGRETPLVFLKKAPIAHLAIAVLLVITSTSAGIGAYNGTETDDQQIRNEISGRVRSTDDMELPKTSMLLSVEDNEWVSQTENLKLGEGTYYEIDDLTYNELDQIKADASSTYRMLSSRSTFSHKGTYLVAYVILVDINSRSYRFMLSGSTDQGSTWDHVEVMSRVDIHEPRVELTVHEDKLFYVSSMSPASIANRVDIFARVTPFANWLNLSHVEPETFMINGDEAFTQLIGLDGRLILFVKDQAYTRPDYHTYQNGTWWPVRTMPYSTLSFSAVKLFRNNMEYIHFLYLDGTSPSAIREVHTTNGGGTWSGPTAVATASQTIKYIVATSDGEDIYGALNYLNSEDIGHFIYDGSTLSELDHYFTSGSNGLDSDDKEITIGMMGDDIIVAFEDEGGTISIARSFDKGRSFNRVIHGSGNVHSPSIAGDLSLFAYMNGPNIQIADMRNAGTALLVTNVISAPGVSSWDQIGLSLGGASLEGSFELMIRSEDGDQLFPSSGTLSVHSFGPDHMGVHHFQHVIDLSELNEGGCPERISIGFQFSSLNGERPTLFSFLLNYTVAYPYEMKIVDEMDMVDMSNVRVSAVGLELENTHISGFAVIGPFKIEEGMPHHLWAKGTFLNIEDTCTFSILASNHFSMGSFDGFSNDLSDELVKAGEFVPIKWGRLNLHDLPPFVSEFYVKVDIQRTGSLSPRLTSLRIGYTSPPEIEEVDIEQIEIYRDISTEVHIQVSDPEEPADHLHLDVMIMAPGSDDWTCMGISDPMWNGEDWEVTVTTDILSVVGNYSFKVNLSDGIGAFGEEMIVTDLLLVLNNVPTPPMVKIDPALPVTGDTLTFMMISPGSDIETDIFDLTYNIYLFKGGDLYKKLDNQTTPDILLDDPVLAKDEVWDILFTTWDGVEESEPFRVELRVLNSWPLIIWDGKSIDILEDEVDTALDPDEWFRDPDGDELEFTVKGPIEISPYVQDGVVMFDQLEDHNGPSWLWVNAFDGDVNVSINITMNIIEVNDIPVWNHFETLTVYEGEWIFVDISARDLRDHELPVVSINDFVPGIIEGVNLIFYPNGSFMFQPDNSMVGTHRVLLDVEDGHSITSDSFNITVLNTNQPPERPAVTPGGNVHVYEHDERIVLSAVSLDPDLIWGDDLTYLWTSSIDDDLGQGENITPVLSVGIHTVTVTARDTEGEMNSTSISIEVLAKEKEDGTVMRTWMVYGMSCFLPLLLGIIIGVAIILLARKKKEEKKDNKDIKDEKEEGSSADPPGLKITDKDERTSLPGPSLQSANAQQPERVLPPHTPEQTTYPVVNEARPQPPSSENAEPQAKPPNDQDQGPTPPKITDPVVPRSTPNPATGPVSVGMQPTPPPTRSSNDPVPEEIVPHYDAEKEASQ